MLVDEVVIHVESGRGGDGAVSFRREKYVPKGGPDGGHGGKGGDVIFRANPGIGTLAWFRGHRRFMAESGSNGEGNCRTGRDGQDVVLEVPLGTVIRDKRTSRVLADVTDSGVDYLIAKGGKGGSGNSAFATPSRRTPRFAKKGGPAESYELELELKLISDVGLVGAPNAGKSTLISRISGAKPKIADYPFTTLEPYLGVVRVGDFEFVVADLPGLIEGAHEGVGLGHRFLRHIERTRILLHLVDVSGVGQKDPVLEYQSVKSELELYRADLRDRPQVVAGTKIDAAVSDDGVRNLRKAAEADGREFHIISSVSGEGIRTLLSSLADLVREAREADTADDQEDEGFATYTGDFEDEILVRKHGEGLYVVSGPGVQRRLSFVGLEDMESLRYFHRVLARTGVISKLREAGASNGDTVRIGDREFEFLDEEEW